MKRQIHRHVGFLIAFLLIAAAALAQPVLEPRHSALIETFAARFAPPMQNEDHLRDWTASLCEQFAFTFPTEGWGHKRAAGPPSSDVIARQFGGRVYGYDLVIGAGTSGARLEAHAAPMDITGQTFIPVEAVNHLGGGDTGGGTGGGGNTGGGATVDLTAVLAELAQTRVAQQQTLTALVAMAAALDRARELIEEQKNHDLVIANELRISRAELKAALEQVRAQVAGGIRIRF